MVEVDVMVVVVVFVDLINKGAFNSSSVAKNVPYSEAEDEVISIIGVVVIFSFLLLFFFLLLLLLLRFLKRLGMLKEELIEYFKADDSRGYYYYSYDCLQLDCCCCEGMICIGLPFSLILLKIDQRQLVDLD